MKHPLTLIFLLVAGFSTTAWCGKIVYPWNATTAIVVAGEDFEVWFNADEEQTVKSVELRGPYNTVKSTIKSQLTSTWEYDRHSGNTYNRKITVNVPSSTPWDRYDLILKTSNGDEISRRSVKVIKEYKSSYYIMHISDAHRFGSRAELSDEKVSELIKICNIIDPEFLIETGDNTYSVAEDDNETALRVDNHMYGDESNGELGVTDAFAASFTVAGNHDAPKNSSQHHSDIELANHWNKFYGLHIYNFIYGNGRFMVMNDGWSGLAVNDKMNQCEDANDWLSEVGHGKYKWIAVHIKDKFGPTMNGKLDVDIEIVGHNHHKAVENPVMHDGYTTYVCNAIREYFEFNLYRVNNCDGSLTTPSDSTARVHALYSGDKDDEESWELGLTLDYSAANDGSSLVNTATIKNTFNFAIDDARVRFVMPKGNTYEVSNGTITQQFEGDAFRIVDVNVNLNANSVNVIEIHPDKSDSEDSK